jgi:hypothetical protein
MLRIILVAVAVFLMLICAAAVGLYAWLGWKGLAVFPVVLLLFLWIAKMIIGKLIKAVGVGLFSIKARALRDARLTVNSIISIPPPEDTKSNPATENETAAPIAEEKEPEYDYYLADITITPAEANQSMGWEASELILTSAKIKGLEDLQEKEVGHTHDVLVWDGKEFQEDAGDKPPGTQRLKITFALKPGVFTAYLYYYNEVVGLINFPVASRLAGVK